MEEEEKENNVNESKDRYMLGNEDIDEDTVVKIEKIKSNLDVKPEKGNSKLDGRNKRETKSYRKTGIKRTQYCREG